jgi:hypothetical protein
MNRITMLALCMLMYGLTATAQITKGNWMVGGIASYASTKYHGEISPGVTVNIFKVQPNIGYFIIDKLATGLKLGYSNVTNKVGEFPYGITKTVDYNFGPFIRYYFLSPDKPFNILIDGSYQYGIKRGGSTSGGGDIPWTQHNANTFSVNAGPVLYFNTSVGLEFLVGYSTEKYVKDHGRNGTVQVGLGLQVHLERDK